jgi:chromosome segregation ATPase
MASKQELQTICDRSLQALTEVRQNVVKLANLEVEIKQAESKLAALNGQIEQANPMAAQIEELGQRIKTKRHELAELELQISKKSVEHGTIDGELRSLMKRASSLVQPA